MIDYPSLKKLEEEKGIKVDLVLEQISEKLLNYYHSLPGAVENAKIEFIESLGAFSVIASVIDDDGNLDRFDDTPNSFTRFSQQILREVLESRLAEIYNREITNFVHQLTKDNSKDDHNQTVVIGSNDSLCAPNMLISGVVKETNRQNEVVVTLSNKSRTNKSKANSIEAYLPLTERMSSDRYLPGQRFSFYLLTLDDSEIRSKIILSRSHPQLVRLLLKKYVPEVEKGLVEIKEVVREPGFRAKVAVYSPDPNVKPVSSCIGPMANRIKSVIKELSGERIDLIEWNADISQFIAFSLRPAQVSEVIILSDEQRQCVAKVEETEYLNAIGKDGQNVRLAARLTGYHIDIQQL